MHARRPPLVSRFRAAAAVSVHDAHLRMDAARTSSAAANAPSVWAPADESRLELYARIIRSSPWYHRLFLALVAVETIYTIAERCSVFALTTEGVDDDAIWFLGVIIISVCFAAYYGIHAVISVNVREATTRSACRLRRDQLGGSLHCVVVCGWSG